MHYRWGSVGRLLPAIEHRLEPVAGMDRGGQLWVKGPNIMLGYLRYEHPGVLEPPEDGWYDTGDIVDIDAQGFVTILGRAKRFAKIGGEMVSLGAVEDFIHRTSPEAQHAVVALPDPRKGERIVLVTTDQTLERETPGQGRARARRQRSHAPGRGDPPPRPAAAGDREDGLSERAEDRDGVSGGGVTDQPDATN